MGDAQEDLTETQKEWDDWARHGYRKLYQPRSVLWFGGVFFAHLQRRTAGRVLARPQRPLA
jgi:hypothetical protein